MNGLNPFKPGDFHDKWTYDTFGNYFEINHRLEGIPN